MDSKITCPDYWLRTWNRPGHRQLFAKEGAVFLSARTENELSATAQDFQ